ncbi:MAG: hypothetical protein ACE5KH_06815 [Candidatus Geothermarchaeales archaeon]
MPLRIWAILQFLDRKRVEGGSCKLWDLQIYLRSNWKATNSDVEFAIDRGWISVDDSDRTFSITDEGRRYLTELRRGLEPFYEERMDLFRRRE